MGMSRNVNNSMHLGRGPTLSILPCQESPCMLGPSVPPTLASEAALVSLLGRKLEAHQNSAPLTSLFGVTFAVPSFSRDPPTS